MSFPNRSLRSRVLLAALGSAGALAFAPRDASAADLLVCTGTEFDLRQQLIVDTPADGLVVIPRPISVPLDDGSVLVEPVLIDQIFENGIPFINNYDQIFANVNGTLTFEQALPQFTPDAIPGLLQPTIAGYFGDVDLRPLVGSPGSFTLCLEPANDRLFFTWELVGYYDSHIDLLNSFQIVLTDNDALVCPANGNFEVEFRYQQLQWTTGDASGGIGGLGGTQATAGIDAGDGINAIGLPGSGTAQVLDLVNQTNADDPGLFRFLVAEGTLPDCGNAQADLCEQCDDGDQDNNDACTNLCLNARCGDDLIQDGVEECDGTQIGAAVCPPGTSGTPLCNNDPANPTGDATCTIDDPPDGCVPDGSSSSSASSSASSASSVSVSVSASVSVSVSVSASSGQGGGGGDGGNGQGGGSGGNGQGGGSGGNGQGGGTGGNGQGGGTGGAGDGGAGPGGGGDVGGAGGTGQGAGDPGVGGNGQGPGPGVTSGGTTGPGTGTTGPTGPANGSGGDDTAFDGIASGGACSASGGRTSSGALGALGALAMAAVAMVARRRRRG